ncbi:MAG: hypothetical protein IPP23_10015 [Sphingomonadales bacterium]|nr:hypothetical protein [Sphingomonadales bacterium]
MLLAGPRRYFSGGKAWGSGRSDGDQSTECNWLAARLAEKLRPASDNIGAQVHLRIADPVRALPSTMNLPNACFRVFVSGNPDAAQESLVGRFSTELGTPVVNQFALTLPEQLRTVRRRNACSASTAVATPLLGLIFAAAGTKSCQQRRRQFTVSKDRLLVQLPAAENDRFLYKDRRTE